MNSCRRPILDAAERASVPVAIAAAQPASSRFGPKAQWSRLEAGVLPRPARREPVTAVLAGPARCEPLLELPETSSFLAHPLRTGSITCGSDKAHPGD